MTNRIHTNPRAADVELHTTSRPISRGSSFSHSRESASSSRQHGKQTCPKAAKAGHNRRSWITRTSPGAEAVQAVRQRGQSRSSARPAKPNPHSRGHQSRANTPAGFVPPTLSPAGVTLSRAVSA